jgi:hypothetical protein
MATVLALLVASARAFAQGPPPTWRAAATSARTWNPPPPWAPPTPTPWQPQWTSTPPPIRLPWEWQSVGITLGGAHYIESATFPVTVRFGDGIGQAQNFVTRGGWVGIEAEYMTARWLALAARGRFGSLRRGPPNPPEEEYPAGTDLRRIDPQLGDGPYGGAIGFFFRFLPKRTALDAGLTASMGSFRPRFGSHPLIKCSTCSREGQGTYGGEEFWPTIRVSRTGPGFVFAVGTGESFVRTYETTVLELLLGYRGDDIEFLGGLGRGLAFRIDVRAWSSLWISFDVSTNPWNGSVPGYDSPRSILTVTFTQRWSSFAPL